MTQNRDDMPADDFSLWFALKAAAADNDWALVAEHIAGSAAQPIVRHPLTIPVMQSAVTTGKTGVVAELLARGFVPQREDIKAIIDLIEFTEPENLDAVAIALKQVTAQIDPSELRTLIANVWRSAGADKMIPQMNAAGLDVLLGGEVIDIVVASQNFGLMLLMLEQGASPFAPKTVAAMVGAQDVEPDMKRAWWLAACAHRDYKTALMKFEAMCVSGGDWRAGAFLNPLSYDKAGQPVTLLGILAAQGKLNDVFQATHWQNTAGDAVAVHEALVHYGLKDSVSLAHMAAAINRHALAQRKSGDNRFKL